MKTSLINTEFKLGVLGGGQLGKMMALAAGNWHLPIYMLDKASDYPAGPYTSGFSVGDFKNFDDVYQFGQDKDVLTIEIEHVNTKALYKLQEEGKIIHPDPKQLDIIKDKGLQKQFYRLHALPTSPYALYDNTEAILSAVAAGKLQLPFVQKSRTAGYDGKGVLVVDGQDDLDRLLPGPSMVEEKVKIDKELAVIVARNPSGEVKAFPTVEMAFNPAANLVEYLFSPARIAPDIEMAAQELAKKTIDAFGICGLLAVELFLDQEGQLLINEVAPRPHNSGHHTIESSVTSQFQQHLRAILNLPLGSTQQTVAAAVMVNLLGSPDHRGTAIYQGINDCLAMEGVFLHLYGKKETKPFRKMGHATIIGSDLETAIKKAQVVKNNLQIIA